MSTAEDLGARLDALESRDALARLAQAYCQAFDGRDLQRFLAVWHDDVVWEVLPGTVVEGLDGVRSVAEGGWASLPATAHLVTNHVVDLDGDRATGSAQVLAFVQAADGTWSQMVVTYDDVYERRDGRWGITRRSATPHLQAPVAGAT